MPRWWKRLTAWRCLLLFAYLTLLVTLVGSLVLHYSAAWFGVAVFVLAGVNFVMLQGEAARIARNGSDDDPP